MMERKQKRSLPGLQRMRPSMRVAGFTVALSISLVAGCATARSGADRPSSIAMERSEHPWLDSIIGSSHVSEKQFDEVSWWQQISACISAMFVRGVYDSAALNSERESR